MPLWRIAAAVILSAILASFTDWFFMGVLFHDRNLIYPEVWRTGLDEGSKIMISEVFALLTSIAFVLICAFLLPKSLGAWIAAALLAWLALCAPMLLQNGVWMKLDPLVLASQGAGWLARLLITALVCAWLLLPRRGASAPA